MSMRTGPRTRQLLGTRLVAVRVRLSRVDPIFESHPPVCMKVKRDVRSLSSVYSASESKKPCMGRGHRRPTDRDDDLVISTSETIDDIRARRRPDSPTPSPA